MVQNCEWVSQYAMSMLSSQSMSSASTRRGMLATDPGPLLGQAEPLARIGLPGWPRGAVSWVVPAEAAAGRRVAAGRPGGTSPRRAGAAAVTGFLGHDTTVSVPAPRRRSGP